MNLYKILIQLAFGDSSPLSWCLNENDRRRLIIASTADQRDWNRSPKNTSLEWKSASRYKPRWVAEGENSRAFLPPSVSRAWILFAPSLSPAVHRQAIFPLAKWPSSEISLLPMLRRIDGARKFRWRWKLGIRAGMMPEMAIFPSRITYNIKMTPKWSLKVIFQSFPIHFNVILTLHFNVIVTCRFTSILTFTFDDREREIGSWKWLL